MASFKALTRRSQDAKKHQTPLISTPLTPGVVGNPANPILSKPASAKTFVPTKVIRAVDSRRGANPQELSFNRGDFFYVIRDMDHNGELWYEVNNPVSGARGIVPSQAFEELSKQAPPPRTSGYAIGSPMAPPVTKGSLSYSNGPQSPIPSTPTLRHRAYLAIVQYDFQAERPDELDAKAGEAISVVAQSNREWFVAKPIGRLGGPGLIPVAFVELRDPDAPAKKMSDADVSRAMDEGTLPRVEVWKKATMDYKQSSIPLGVIDPTPSAPPVTSPYPTTTTFEQKQSYPSSGGGDHRHSSSQNIHTGGGQTEFEQPEEEEEELLPLGMPVSASIPSFHQESGEYWFRLDATYQPDPDDANSPDGQLPSPIYMVLYRNYDDFYAFQLTLLDSFPVEAGRVKADPNDRSSLTEADRILPFMPGPVEHVNDQVTVDRKIDLNIYVHELMYLAGDPPNAAYILRSELVRRFFSRKPGDVILDAPPPGARANSGHSGVTGASAALQSQQSQQSATVPNPHQANSTAASSNALSNQASSHPSTSHHSQHSVSSQSFATSNHERDRDRDRERSQSRARSHSNAQSNYGSDPSRLRMNGLSIHDNGSGSGATSSIVVGANGAGGGAEDRLSRASAYSDYKSHRSQRSHGGDITIQPNGHGRGSESPYEQVSYTGGSPTRSQPYSSRSPASSNIPLSTSSPAPPLPDHQYHHPSYSQTSLTSTSAHPSVPPPVPVHAAPGPPSAGPGPTSQFLKLKVFHSNSDDLIALRVSPRITYVQLLDKIRDRLGKDISELKYTMLREGSEKKEMVTIMDDGDLVEWVRENAKLVLYAY